MIPSLVIDWLNVNEYGEVAHIQTVGGGCINHASRLETLSGKKFFLKYNNNAPADLFAREAEGLQALRQARGPRVPGVYLVDNNFLLMEDLSPGLRKKDFWQLLGSQLAMMHQCESPQFGFANDNYIGSTHQPNKWEGDGFTFFAEHRLLFQARLAYDKGRLDRVEMKQVDRLVTKLKHLVPEQPASLLHGDLWSGNILTDENGNPAIIDPAVYYGWAEAELAMMVLFGSLPDGFYHAYQSIRPLDQGFEQRYPIYNLYHLINHLNLFGGGYLGSVKMILKQFS